ncbi:hypothetical protein BJX64DRAFT_294412 [Aspergillus heterothallicus]
MAPRFRTGIDYSRRLESLPTKPESVGRPRLHPYQRLLGRFYEVLFLLQALGRTRGIHTPEPPALDQQQESRRRFLQDLAYICDFQKGGDTCTAIGIEESSHNYTFWVAVNTARDGIAEFLKDVLNILRISVNLTVQEMETHRVMLIRCCIEFASLRINEEKRLLFKAARDCLQRLDTQSSEQVSNVKAWLELLKSKDTNFALCLFAYTNRHSESVQYLENLGLEQERRYSSAKGSLLPYSRVKHYVGRLASHYRVPIRLLDNVKQLSYLLEDFEVQAIKPTPSVPSPKVDSHTTLHGIINRMLKKDAEERLDLEKGLLYLDQTHGIFKKFMDQYKNCEPRIHAEVLALEHFYQSRKSFAANDRYIGCSKAACVCCEMYFKYHPARMVVPKSHRKVWQNWGPPFVENYAQKGPIAKQQLAILNKMTEDLRREILGQVIGCSSPASWHADSRTEITQSRRSSFTSLSEDDSRTDLPENINHWLLHQEAESVKLIAQGQSLLEESVIPDGDSDSDTGGVSLSMEIPEPRETPDKVIYASL